MFRRKIVMLRGFGFLVVLLVCVQNLPLLDHVVLWPNGTRIV
jgi:hypothetical protein